MRHRRRFSGRELNFDPTDLVDSIHDVIEAVMDAGMDSVHAMGDRTTWKTDDLRNEAKAFAARFSAHPSWRMARDRTTRGWSDTD